MFFCGVSVKKFFYSDFKQGFNQNIKQKVSNLDMSNFEIFWKEFRAAVTERDIEKTIMLTHIPFKDYYNDVYDPENSLTSDNVSEFKEKYNLIFDTAIIKAVDAHAVRGYNSILEEIGDVIRKDEYLLESNSQDRRKDLIFSKINGEYRLSGIVYYP